MANVDIHWRAAGDRAVHRVTLKRVLRSTPTEFFYSEAVVACGIGFPADNVFYTAEPVDCEACLSRGSIIDQAASVAAEAWERSQAEAPTQAIIARALARWINGRRDAWERIINL